MKLERYDLDFGCKEGMDYSEMIEVEDGDYVLHSDALAYANEQVKEAKRWKYPEKEKPTKGSTEYLGKFQDTEDPKYIVYDVVTIYGAGKFNAKSRQTQQAVSNGYLKLIGWKEIE